jgi:arsenic resistance protein ArsH
LLTRDVSSYLVDRYSERRENSDELAKRVNQRAL